MPTGYTYPVIDGKITDLKAFVLNCAEAFIGTDRFGDPNDSVAYYEKRLEEDKAELARLQALTIDQQEVEWRTFYSVRLQAWEERGRQYKLEHERLQAMLDKVLAWNPPPTHVHLKDFLVKQLVGSMDLEPTVPLDKPTLDTRSAWYEAAIDMAQREVTYRENQLKTSRERAERQAKWIKELEGSLS